MNLLETRELGSPTPKGNLIGVQPEMLIPDYSCLGCFEEKLDQYFQIMKEKNWLNPKSIVVFPEYVGTWLVAAEASPKVYQTRSITAAMLLLIGTNAGGFFRYLLHAKAKDPVKYALFRMKSEKMLEIYVQAFSALAKRYAVTVVAGSIVLPKLKVTSAGVRLDGDRLRNTTLVFRPDGSPYEEVVYKTYPTPQERPFTEPGEEKELPVFDTPAGRLGILNCADSWYGSPYLHLKERGVDFIAVPSLVEKDDAMGSPWNGKNLTPLPVEFDSRDYFNITYDAAWIKYALAARFEKAGIRHAINVFLRGKFWSLGSDGCSIIVHDNKLYRGKSGKGSALQCVWLN